MKTHGLPSLVTALVVTLLSVSTVAAQESDRQPASEGRGYLTVGVTTIDATSLNDRLDAYAYPALPETMLNVGGGGHGLHGNWVIGGEGAAVIGRAKSSSPRGMAVDTTLNGGYGFFNLGYLVFRQDHMHVYPLIGVGGGGGQLTFQDTAVRSFDELLANPRVGAKASTGGFLMQVALGVDNLFVLGSRVEDGQRREGGIVLGVRAGYVFGPGQDNWRFDGTDLTGGPDLSLTGPYVRVIVGGGGRNAPR